jgi:hypothetical protein
LALKGWERRERARRVRKARPDVALAKTAVRGRAEGGREVFARRMVGRDGIMRGTGWRVESREVDG